jgi:hypothetical protein
MVLGNWGGKNYMVSIQMALLSCSCGMRYEIIFKKTH